MKYCDPLTRTYKEIQNGKLRVFLETFDDHIWSVVSQDTLQSLNQFHSKSDAIEFCKYLGFDILAYVRHK